MASHAATYAHDFLQCLECSARAVAWLTKRFQECRDRLVDRLRADVLLENVERFGSSGSDFGRIIDQGHPDHSDDLVLLTLPLSIRGTLPVAS